MTVGSSLMSLSPVAAFVVVVSHSIVLFLFASQGLESFLQSNGLPTIPLVPVSSSQAVVGAVLGIALLKGGRGIRWRVVGGIGAGWVVTPLIAGVVCFIGLFFLQNVFDQKVYAGGLGKAPVAIFSAPAGTAVGPDPAPARKKTLKALQTVIENSPPGRSVRLPTWLAIQYSNRRKGRNAC